MSKKLVFSILIASLLLLLSACGGYSNKSSETTTNKSTKTDTKSSDTKYSIKLGHQSPEETNVQQFALKFKELVETKTKGEMEVNIFPYRQLGTDRELLEAMQFGTLDMGIINGPPISGFAPETAVVDLPLLFRDWNHVKAFMNSKVKDEYLALTDDAGLKTLSLMTRGYRHITNSKAPINKPEDIKGLKIRVIESPVYVDAYKNVGANPQSMNWADAYTALEQGAIDGQENTLDIIHDENVAEVQKYASKTGINFVFSFMMASKQKFESWPKEIQKAVIESANEASSILNKQNEVNEGEFEKKLTEKGMKINEMDKKQFEGMFDSVYEKWAKEHDDKLMKEIQNLK